MASLREMVKRSAPTFLRNAVIDARARMAAPPLEDSVMHDYEISPSKSEIARLTLVIPSLAPDKIFGGISTGVEMFLQIAKRFGAQARILLDSHDKEIDRAFVIKCAEKAGFTNGEVEITPRSGWTPRVDVGRNDLFMAYNWWTALNLRGLLVKQSQSFQIAKKPLLYIVQEYEPSFYPMSSTHLMARSAFETGDETWGIFNSRELHEYFKVQGHRFGREYAFEPRIPGGLRAYLDKGPVNKEKRILIYGRPNVPRNCFSAIVQGLTLWTRTETRFKDWTIVSAGGAHNPISLDDGRKIIAMGKLSIEDYARALRISAVGISLMSSAHPSYPPLEMAHFGIKTLTNGYLCKNLSEAHDNIVSLNAIDPRTLADALTKVCESFENAPDSGWKAASHMPSYVATSDYVYLDAIAEDLREFL